MDRFAFYEGDSPLHRRNPLIKLAALGVVALVVTPDLKPSTFWFDPGVPLVFFGLLIVNVSIFGHLPITAILRRLLPVGLLTLPYLVLRAFTFDVTRIPDPTPLISIGPQTATLEGLNAGLALVLRVLVYLLSVIAFVMTTDPTGFAVSLMRQVRVSQRLGYAILGRSRFWAMIQSASGTLRAARQLRGMATPRGRFQRALREAGPLLAAARRSADRAALAMASKGFDSDQEREFYRQVRVTVFDWSFLMAVIGMTLVMIEVMIFAGMVDGFSLGLGA
jgi:energy-coupling factor transport system permease protein